jgi:hypothetical protein
MYAFSYAKCLRCLLQNLNEVTRPNYEHNVEDAMTVLPKMTSGIDVNVRFTGYIHVTN